MTVEAPYGGSYVQIPVFNQMVPDEGAKSIKATLDFSGGVDEYVIDLTDAMEKKVIRSVQSLYIDNYGNASDLTITTSLSGQRLLFPANSMGYMPILLGKPAVFKVAATAGKPEIIMMNVPMYPFIWQV